MTSIFISRKLTPASIFKKDLEAAGFEIHGKSLIKFSAVALSKIPKSEWIFFYSKNAVKYFFEGLKKANRRIPKNVKWAAIGTGTGQVLSKKIDRIHFTGSGNTLETSTEFLKLARGETVLFPRAKNSRKTIQRLLENTINDKEIIVYKNEPLSSINIPNCDLLVFTSPMNVKTYFSKMQLFNHQQVFAIGRTTAKTLVSIGIEDFKVAEEPSEAALVKAILEK